MADTETMEGTLRTTTKYNNTYNDPTVLIAVGAHKQH